jgi:hypothetical protein
VYWGAKSAEAHEFPLIVKVQVPVPKHWPIHPVNPDAADAIGVSVTTVPVGKSAEQVLPQLMPGGEDVTVPVPAPLLAISKFLKLLARSAGASGKAGRVSGGGGSMSGEASGYAGSRSKFAMTASTAMSTGRSGEVGAASGRGC